MKHLRKLALCLTVLVCFAVIGWTAPARAEGAGTQGDPYVIDNTTTTWTNGWYTVTENTTIGTRVTVSGNVHLILCDGVELSIPKGIGVTEGNSLTIYGQEGNTGKLTINDVEDSNAGIGGSLDRSNINCSTGGSVTINGGTLDVTGGKNSAGIGGSGDGNVGTVTVNGGTVTVTGGKFGAGIGGGGSIDGNTLFFLDGTVTINGGKVTATGGEIGAGIGCGYCASGERLIITINGGEVIATGISGSAGIGGGWGNAGRNPGGTITINGGKVTATYNGNGVGIGGWDIGTLITLGCANASDSIYASSYESMVNVAEGKYLKDSESGQYYTGEDIDITAIAGRTLVKAEQPNAVTLNTTVGGTVTLSATLAEEDTPITITVDPDADFCLDSLIAAYEENGTAKTVALTQGTGDKANEWTFTMPAAVVTVDAVFVKSIGNSALYIKLNGEYVYDDEPLVFAYTGEAVEPAVIVTRNVDGEEVPLVRGTDYTVAYTDNFGSPDQATDAAVTLTGIGEYGGTKIIPFRISPFDFAKCKATVPNPTYNDGYYIGYFYDGSWNDNHGGIVVKDSQGNTLTYYHYDETSGEMVGDYTYADTRTLEPEKYKEGGDWYLDTECSHLGENCRVTLEGCGDWLGTLTADIVISLPSHEGDGWSFEAGVLSISDAAAMTPKDSYAGYPWFEYSNSVTDIVIGDGITSVPYMAFGGDSSVNPYANVKKVIMPASMKTIGESAFAYMTALTSIDLKNVTDIGITAFNQCVSLEVNVPGTVTSIGGGAFGACKRVAYAVTVSDIENGTVSAGVNYAEAGDTVTLTAKPDEGCELDTLTVTTVSGESVTVENGAFTMPGSNVIVSATFFTPWQSLQNALNAGGTVTLDKNYTALAIDSALEVPEGVTVTLDLNGHTIDRNLTKATRNGNVITVYGNLTVKDTGSGGKITGGRNPTSGGGMVIDGGAVTLSGGSISGNTAIQGNNGGGVYINTGSLTMNGGSVSGNTATSNGGGVFINNGGTLTMNGGDITGNTSREYGGGVLMIGGTLNLSGGSISGNTADGYGGGIYYPLGTLNLSGSPTVTGNVSRGVITDYTLSYGITDNLFVYNGQHVTVTDTLDSTASVGVSLWDNNGETPGVFTSGLSGKGTAANFFSDSDAYRVRLNSDGEAELYELAITFGDPDFVMPASLTTIEESAFEGMTNMTVVDAHGVTSVGANAFGGCTGLKQIRLDRDCAIDDLAFSGCGTVYVYAPAGGETQAYCSKTTNPCVFVEIDETLSSSTGQEGPVYQFPSGSTLPSIKP